MSRYLQQLFLEGVTYTAEEARSIHNTLIGIVLAAFAVIVLMWTINIYGGKAFNIALFLAGGLYIAISFSRPLVAATAAGAGAVAAGLADTDKTQGALTGLRTLYKVTVGALFGFWVLAGLLATWSYQESPASFWYITAMVLTIAVTVEVYNLKSNNISGKIIIGYAVLVILVSFWQTVGGQDRQRLQNLLPDGLSMATSLKGDPVPFETLQAPGHTVKKWVPLGSTMTVSQKRPPRGQYWLPCGKVVNPTSVLALPGVPTRHIVVASRHDGWSQDHELHPELVKALLAEKLTGVWVEFTLTLAPGRAKAKTHCPHAEW